MGGHLVTEKNFKINLTAQRKVINLLSLQVLAVFNLKDPQSQFGDWISLFFKAAFMAEGISLHHILRINIIMKVRLRAKFCKLYRCSPCTLFL